VGDVGAGLGEGGGPVEGDLDVAAGNERVGDDDLVAGAVLVADDHVVGGGGVGVVVNEVDGVGGVAGAEAVGEDDGLAEELGAPGGLDHLDVGDEDQVRVVGSGDGDAREGAGLVA